MKSLKNHALTWRTTLPAAVSLLALAGLGTAVPAHAQVSPSIIGSYDNFDAFNDTGQTAEGFEIDVEDVNVADVTREFPSNFSQPWLIRYGLPTMTAYDWTTPGSTPDAAHAYDAGHKGVLITWAATKQGGVWVASQGDAVAAGAPGVAGNGTPYNPAPTATTGESCWWWGLGATYPDAGCDHFGISFAAGVTPGKISYHWQVPDATNTVLVNAALEAAIPPSPVLTLLPPAVAGAPPVVQAVAQAPPDAARNPERPQVREPRFGDAYWLRTITFYGPVDAQLDQLQIHLIKGVKLKKTTTWTLLQKPPGIGKKAKSPEREKVEKDDFGNLKNVQVTKQYQYYAFGGAYDSETHEALCDKFYATQAAALSGGATVQASCQNAAGADTPYQRAYWTIDTGTGAAVLAKKGDLGVYIGAHVNAYNVK